MWRAKLNPIPAKLDQNPVLQVIYFDEEGNIFTKEYNVRSFSSIESVVALIKAELNFTGNYYKVAKDLQSLVGQVIEPDPPEDIK